VTTATAEVRRRIGHAPEEPLFYAGLTAREFVELAARLHGMDARAARDAAERLLAEMALSDRADDVILEPPPSAASRWRRYWPTSASTISAPRAGISSR
jgi:hypothetical protein